MHCLGRLVCLYSKPQGCDSCLQRGVSRPHLLLQDIHTVHFLLPFDWEGLAASHRLRGLTGAPPSSACRLQSGFRGCLVSHLMLALPLAWR